MPDLFDAANEPKRKRLRELGWIKSTIFRDRWYPPECPKGSVGITEEEAFRRLAREEADGLPD